MFVYTRGSLTEHLFISFFSDYLFVAKIGTKDNKPFAISHVSSISQDQTTLADGDHSLLVYSVSRSGLLGRNLISVHLSVITINV